MTPGEAAREAWGRHWEAAPQAGRGTPGWSSIAYEAECWEIAAMAAIAQALLVEESIASD